MPDKTARAPDCFSGACDAARSVAAWCSGGDAFRLPDLTAAAEALAHDLPEVLGVQRVWWLDRDGRRAVVGESTHGMLLLDADEPELGADLLQRVVAAGGPRHVLAPESLWRIAPLASSTPAAVHDVFSSDPSLARADLGEGTVLREVPRGSSRATTVAATTRLRALTSSEVRSIELRVVLDRLQSAVADIPVSEEQIDVLAAAVQAGRGIHAICGGEPGQEADDIVGIVLEETAGTSARQVSIAVHPRHERRGHARAALRHLAGVEGARGRRVLTYVAPHNRASAALARSAGFRHVGRIGALEVAT